MASEEKVDDVNEGKRQCPYCSREFGSKRLQKHVREQHPNEQKVRYFAPLTRPFNQLDSVLEENLSELGHPGGDLEMRDGYMLNFNKDQNVANFVYELLNERCSSRLLSKNPKNYKADRLLPLKNILTLKDIRLGTKPEGFHLGHLASYANHNYDEKEDAAANLMSNLCLQYSQLNMGALKVVENEARARCQIFKTHCFTGTIVRAGAPRYGSVGTMALPEKIFKLIVLQLNPECYYYDAFLFPNNSECDNVQDPEIFRTTLAQINTETNFNFLHNIQDKLHTKTHDMNLQTLISRRTTSSSDKGASQLIEENIKLKTKLAGKEKETIQLEKDRLELQRNMAKYKQSGTALVLKLQTAQIEIQNLRQKLVRSESLRIEAEALVKRRKIN